MLALHCCEQAFSSSGEQRLLSSCCAGLLMQCLVAERALGPLASVAVACGLSYPVARGIFPDQGSNLCPLLRHADS